MKVINTLSLNMKMEKSKYGTLLLLELLLNKERFIKYQKV